jgi:hypothetical protein
METPVALFGRAADMEYIRQCGTIGTCCSLVGISNLGKSALLRDLCSPTKQIAGMPTFVYVDCNQMPERTARAFFTAIWHALAERLHGAEQHAQGRRLYEEMIHAPQAWSAYLHFDKGLTLALDDLPRPLVLCFDEFDEAYQNLEPQTFLNLREWRDRYGDALTYVTATERELARLTTNREQGEFYELFVPRVRFMHLMEPEDTHRFCQAFATHEHVTFSQADLGFVRENADGHPGLAQAVCYALGNVTGAPVRNAQQDRVIHERVQESLRSDPNVQSECEKIWGDLEPDERESLLHLHRTEANQTPADEIARRGLRDKFIVRDSDEGLSLFCRLFDDYVHRLKLIQHPDQRGVYIDVDAGDVWVDGKPVQALTDLEYRLLLFLYGRLEHVCNKYSIVETVWGQDYIDKVDDTRIEKLVSRLRKKIEVDPTHPRYLQSLRGRGYKLVR